MRVPVHEPLVAIDQALPVQLDEDLGHRAHHVVVGIVAVAHREGFLRPVARRAKALQLTDNRAAGFLFPFPDAINKGLAAHVPASDIVTGLGHLAFDHHLRCDAGMVGARLPQHILAAHALEPDQDILQRIVQGVPHVQNAGDIRRRDDDGISLCRRVAGGFEASVFFPGLVQAGFGFGGVKSLVEHRFRRIPSKRKGAPVTARPSL